MPDESVFDWKAKVSLVLTFDLESGELVVDRGPLPRMLANAILGQIEDADFCYSDESYADSDVEGSE